MRDKKSALFEGKWCEEDVSAICDEFRKSSRKLDDLFYVKKRQRRKKLIK